MDYVNDASAALARSYARRLQVLPPGAGILFISVLAVPTSNGKSDTFEVRLGVSKNVGPNAGVALAQLALKEAIESGSKFNVRAYEGVSGASRDYDGNEEAGPTPS